MSDSLDRKGQLVSRYLSSSSILSGTRHRNFAGKSFIDFASRDLLGLGAELVHKRELFSELESGELLATLPAGLGGVSPSLSLAMRRLAVFLQKKAAYLFPCRNQAYWSLASSILSERDAVFVEYSHQSAFTDVAELIGAEIFPFYAEEDEKFFSLIETCIARRQRIFVLLETIKSYNFCRFPETILSFLAAHPELSIIADETQAFSLQGIRGAGVFDGHAAHKNCGAVVVDFSQVCGLPATLLALNDDIAESILEYSTYLKYELPLPGVIASAVASYVEACELATQRRTKLSQFSARVYERLSRTHVQKTIPCHYPALLYEFATLKEAERFSEALGSRGVMAELRATPYLRSPTAVVQLRFACGHSKEDEATLLQSLEEVFKRGGFSPIAYSELCWPQ